jgi:hypothetical protein
MPRKLILALDGTSDQYHADNSNVIKFVATLDKNATDQAIYYQPGIGTLLPPGIFGSAPRWIVTRVDLAFGTLLKYHVQDAYAFLMRYYEAGDEIYIIGFSRGAYTARVLAAMLFKVGLLARGNEELVPFAWTMYQARGNDDLAHAFRNTLGRKVPIAFVGLWDTVSSVRWGWWDRAYPYTRDNSSVAIVRHAMALDERRVFFRQNLWTTTPRPGQSLLQVWFPGVHRDVGGGYPESESGLSKIPLGWMINHARNAGLAFHAGALALILPPVSTPAFAAPDPTAPLHRSLQGLWWLLEILPHRIHDPARDFAVRWIIPLGRRRHVNDGAVLHQSVVDRMKRVGGYAPPNLPATYTVDDGTLAPPPYSPPDATTIPLPAERTPAAGTVGLDFNAPARQRRKAAPNLLAIVLMLVGVVWLLQGINLLPGSFMTGDSKWAVIGAILITLSLLTLIRVAVLQYIINTFAGLAIAIGLIWTVQGIGWLRGSVMTGDPHWTRNGAIAVVAGAVALYLNRTKRGDVPGAAQA